MTEGTVESQGGGKKGVSVRVPGEGIISVKAKGLSTEAVTETMAGLLKENPKMTMLEASQRIKEIQQEGKKK